MSSRITATRTEAGGKAVPAVQRSLLPGRCWRSEQRCETQAWSALAPHRARRCEESREPQPRCCARAAALAAEAWPSHHHRAGESGAVPRPNDIMLSTSSRACAPTAVARRGTGLRGRSTRLIESGAACPATASSSVFPLPSSCSKTARTSGGGARNRVRIVSRAADHFSLDSPFRAGQRQFGRPWREVS